MKLFTALAALTLIAAPAYAVSYEQAYTGGALYGAACAVREGRINESQAGLVVVTTLREQGISTSYVSDPVAQQLALLTYARKGGCR